MTNLEVLKKLNNVQTCEVLFALVKPFLEGDKNTEKAMKRKIMKFLLSEAATKKPTE